MKKIACITILSMFSLHSSQTLCMKYLSAIRSFATLHHNSFMDYYRQLLNTPSSQELKDSLATQPQVTKNKLLIDVIKAKGFHTQAINTLLQSGADLNAPDDMRDTALHHLALKTRSEPHATAYSEIIELCIKYFPDFEARGQHGLHPKELAERGHRSHFVSPLSNAQQLLKIIKKLEDLDSKVTEIFEKVTYKKD